MEDIIYKISEFLKLQSSLAKLRTLKTMDQMSQQQEALYNKILDTIERLRNTLTMHDTRIGEITENINRVYAGNIYIEGIINENTNINIGAACKKITNAKARVHFYLTEGEIAESEFVMVPEIKKVLETG
jgi:uncharacterized protein (DUF342 family)